MKCGWLDRLTRFHIGHCIFCCACRMSSNFKCWGNRYASYDEWISWTCHTKSVKQVCMDSQFVFYNLYIHHGEKDKFYYILAKSLYVLILSSHPTLTNLRIWHSVIKYLSNQFKPDFFQITVGNNMICPAELLYCWYSSTNSSHKQWYTQLELLYCLSIKLYCALYVRVAGDLNFKQQIFWSWLVLWIGVVTDHHM
jgi:hypothetical protein